MTRITHSLAAACAALALLGSAVHAQARQERNDPRDRPSAGYRTPHVHFDALHRHNHYYPAPGYDVPSLPWGSISIRFQNSPYFFHSGVWYRPSGARFIVVLPPVGIFIPMLPPAYVTLWIGGVVYYYANGVYYAPAGADGYVVVAPPPGADTAQVAPALPEPVIYPRNGQSAEQTQVDRRECDAWALTQPGARADASVLRRAFTACMDGRGYTVR